MRKRMFEGRKHHRIIGWRQRLGLAIGIVGAQAAFSPIGDHIGLPWFLLSFLVMLAGFILWVTARSAE